MPYNRIASGGRQFFYACCSNKNLHNILVSLYKKGDGLTSYKKDLHF
jgi:hypothetical protein